MKVLQINCVYKGGSTGRIVEGIHKYLNNNNIESVVLYGREFGVPSDEADVYKISTELEAKIHSVLFRLFSVEFGYSPIATKKAISIIKNEKPDVVHLHVFCGNFINVYKLLDYLKKNHYKTVITLHAEILHTAGCEHAVTCEKWKTGCYDCRKIDGKISKHFRDDAKHCADLIKKSLSGFEDLTLVGVSSWLTDRAKQADVITKAEFSTVHNGLDTSVFHYTPSAALKRKYNIDENRKMILHVTPSFNHPIKGGKYILELAKRMPEYQFVIVGFDGEKADLTDNIIALSHTQDAKELVSFYSTADCVIITSLRETFSMVALEAISCGNKAVAFAAGGITEVIPEDRGECVPCYDIDAFELAVRKWADIVIPEENKSDYTASSDFHKMAKDYLDIYKGK